MHYIHDGDLVLSLVTRYGHGESIRAHLTHTYSFTEVELENGHLP